MCFRILIAAPLAAVIVASVSVAYAENMDPNDDGSQYAYGENVGWLNFEPNQRAGATVSDANLTGFVWSENIGWINLSPRYGGVINDGYGVLSGYAWGENVGWINFNPKVADDPNNYGVTIDSEGNFDGCAWGENIGWIRFQGAFKVDWDDLANFAAQWLQTGSGLQADLYEDEKVDSLDYTILADSWLDYSPDGWELAPADYKVRTSWTPMP